MHSVRTRSVICLCHAFFFDPGEDGTPRCPIHQKRHKDRVMDRKLRYSRKQLYQRTRKPR